MKKILVIQDLVSVGKAGLSVSIPVLSSMFIEPVAVPLTLQPVSFENSQSIDFSQNFNNYASSFNENMIHFDCIFFNFPDYFLNEEINQCCLIDSCQANDTFLAVNFCNCKNASLTQALYSSAYIKNANLIISKSKAFPGLINSSKADAEVILSAFVKAPGKIVIPDYKVSGEKSAVITYDKITGKFSWIYYKNFPGDISDFAGFWDLFSSILTGAVVNGFSLENAGRTAINFIQQCCQDTFNSRDYNFYGLNFEKKLPELSKIISDNSGI